LFTALAIVFHSPEHGILALLALAFASRLAQHNAKRGLGQTNIGFVR
jgi:hypothetical protein